MTSAIPSPAEINYFMEAATTGNFSRAAARLGISQPSLSAAMVRLEDSVGAKLFLRSRRGVELTRSGRQLFEHSQRLMNAWLELQNSAVAATEEVQGKYTIGAHPSVALYTLGGFLPEVLHKNPNLNINLRHDLSRRITENVIQGEIDVAIAVNPRPHPDLIISRLTTDDVTLWQKATKRGQKPQLQKREGILICDTGLIQTQAIMKRLKFPQATPRIIESSNLEVICELTAAGVGVGILPTRVAQRASSSLVKIHGAPVFRDEICLVIRAEQRKVAAIRCLTAAIKKSFES
ncbi:MAG: HTH-type transcriptional regulator YofA [Pseudomonadota bacterium]|jgi:DNA-binding transcriptional LysR family regulator